MSLCAAEASSACLMESQGPARPVLDPYRALLASDADCIKMLDREGRICDINPAGPQLMEADRTEQVLGLDWLAFWQEEREQAHAAFGQGLAGHASRFEGSAPTLRGTMRRWANLLTPVRSDDGTITHLLAITRDITDAYEATRNLALAEQRSAALIRAISQIVWRAQGDRKVDGQDDWLRFCGLDEEKSRTFDWFSAVHPADHDRVQARVLRGVAEGEPYEVSYRLTHHSGTWRWVQDRAVPIRDGAGVVTEWVGLIVDIHDRVEAETALRESAEQLHLAVQAGQLGIWDRNLAEDKLRWSPELKRMFRIPEEAVVDTRLILSLVHPDDRPLVLDFIERPAAWTADTTRYTCRIIRPDDGEVRWITFCGRQYYDETGIAVRRVGTCQDVTDAILAEQRLWRAANHDPLTGLANRNLFSATLDAAVQRSQTDTAPFGLLLLDLDEFKAINDRLGHAVGDAVLKGVADRLSCACPDGATVARLGGDEFAVLVPWGMTAEDAESLAAQLTDALCQPMPHETGIVCCGASCGVVLCPDESGAPADALKNADLALYEAKKGGPSRHRLFTTGMKSRLVHRATILQTVEEALAANLIVPFYQPKVELATGRIDGFEALLRWWDGSVWRSPGSIGEAFSHPRFAARLGDRIVQGVVADLRRWRAQGLAVGRIAVNMSAVEFSTTDVAECLIGRLREAGLTPNDLDLEVTESVILGPQSMRVGEALRRLDQQGMAIALDDFGTGYASLTHLRQYPFDWLKIDRSFVADIEGDADAAAIVSAVIGLAHSLGRRVVAEGIETAAQLAALRRSGCDVVQGYFLARPMPAAEVPAFVETWAGFGRDEASPCVPPCRSAAIAGSTGMELHHYS